MENILDSKEEVNLINLFKIIIMSAYNYKQYLNN